MPTYEVTITDEILPTYKVRAKSAAEAEEKAFDRHRKHMSSKALKHLMSGTPDVYFMINLDTGETE